MQRHLPKLTIPATFQVSPGRTIRCCVKIYMVPVTTLIWLDLEGISLAWHLTKVNVQNRKIKRWDVHFLAE